MSAVSNLFKQISNFWGNLSGRQRTVVSVGLILVTVFTLLFTVFFSARPEMVPVFSQLSSKDMTAIAATLAEAGVKYEVSKDGQAIMVEKSRVYQTRSMLAEKGLPSLGVVGFEIFDKTNLGASEYQQRINYLRALEGELTRTITAFDAVEQARVHIVLPEPSLYVKNQKPATAAVWLKLKPTASLSPAQVKGIIHLLSYSVEGLAPEAVTVIDVNGNILSADIATDSGGTDQQTANRLDLQRRFQKELEQSVQTLLSQVFGPGNVSVRVAAELNFDQRVVEKQLFEPLSDGTGVARRVYELEEYFKGTQTAVGGVPGAESNTPGYQEPSGTGSSESEKRESTIEYEINEIRERLVVAPGTVRRLSVAVVINRELSEAESRAIATTVSSAIGADPTRNDQISVSGIKFDTTAAEAIRADMEKQARAERTRQLILLPALSLVGLVVIIWVLAALRRPAPRPVPAMALAEQAASLEEIISPEDRDRHRLRDQIRKLARQRPEDVASLLKSWLQED
ncbi:MAG: flagellar basal-body MS-ring/collar protein FliF [Bacillota bacterium]